MIKPLTFAALQLCTVLSTGCCPDGCFVVHGELYQRLAHPKPYIEFWEKTGVSEDQRSLDWVACGGASNGDFSPAIGRVKEEMRPDENDFNAAHKRLQEKLKHCMRGKGYEYRGTTSSAPAPQRSTE